MCLLRNMYQLLIALNIILQSATSLPSDDQSTETIPEPKLGNRCANLSKFILRKPEDGSSNAFFLVRPRKFGKSILVDTMFEFFNGNRQLFKDTFIGKNHTEPWIKYPVIRLDFSRGLSIGSVEHFNADLKAKLQLVAHSYQINLNAPSPVSAIEELTWKLKDAKKSPVVVLIDAYDSPYCHAYVNNKTEAQKILIVLHNFFSTLKGDANIHLSFITGVNRLPIKNFFSGLDTDTDLTMDSNYPAIVGFTEEELRDYFGDFINNVATIRQKEAIAILELMEWYHGGFQSSSAHVRVHNPYSAITYLNSEGNETTGCREIVRSGSFLEVKFKEFEEIAVLYVKVNQIGSNSLGGIPAKVRSLRGKPRDIRYVKGKPYFTNEDAQSFTALLFQDGYLSIESCKGEDCCLRFSNTPLYDDFLQRASDLRFESNSMWQELFF